MQTSPAGLRGRNAARGNGGSWRPRHKRGDFSVKVERRVRRKRGHDSCSQRDTLNTVPTTMCCSRTRGIWYPTESFIAPPVLGPRLREIYGAVAPVCSGTWAHMGTMTLSHCRFGLPQTLALPFFASQEFSFTPCVLTSAKSPPSVWQDSLIVRTERS